MHRKICHIGNSQGISIPKDMLEKLHLAAGAEVDVNLDEESSRIIIKPIVEKSMHEAIDEKFASQVSDFLERYRPALKALAK